MKKINYLVIFISVVFLISSVYAIGNYGVFHNIFIDSNNYNSVYSSNYSSILNSNSVNNETNQNEISLNLSHGKNINKFLLNSEKKVNLTEITLNSVNKVIPFIENTTNENARFYIYSLDDGLTYDEILELESKEKQWYIDNNVYSKPDYNSLRTVVYKINDTPDDLIEINSYEDEPVINTEMGSTSNLENEVVYV